MVVITGDFITLESGWSEGLDYLLPHIPRGRFGTLAVLGNHDYGSSFSDGSFADKISERIAGSGIQLLRNQESIFEGLRVIGLDDLWARRTDARLLKASPAKALPTIVLAHNPDTFDLPELDGFTGLMLSGHTHGGQCRPPFLPPPLLPVKNRNYTEGLFVNKTNGSLYINRGVGFLVRARFNVRPEATIIDLC